MSTAAATAPATSPWGKRLGAIAVLGALLAALRFLPIEHWLLDFVAWVRDAGARGIAAFVIAYVVLGLVIPGSVLTLGAGFAYGVVLGTTVVWVAANLTAVVAFILGRTLARDAIAARVGANPRFAAIDRAIGREGLKIVLLVRLSPIFPFTLLNYALGLTRVAVRDYVVGSLIGMLPGTLMYVYLGSLVTSLTELAAGRPSGGALQKVFYFGGLVATIAVTLYVTRVARRALADATGEEARAEPAPAGPPSLIQPDDAYNRALLAHVHPPGWTNPTPTARYDLVVIGGGTAGLVSAAGAAGLGARVALVERHLLGGDCLNVGCVPSKAIIAAARAAAVARDGAPFGVRVSGVDVDFAAVMARMRRLRAEIAPHDGAERFKGLGVDVFLGDGRFTGPRTVEVDGQQLPFVRAVIATGARATAPPIPGLEDAGYLTNETVFQLTERPRRLAIIGAGPIGCELAQAFARLGSRVTALEMLPQVLGKEDPDAATIVDRRLRADGVDVVLGARIDRVERRGADRVIVYTVEGARREVACDAILVGAGRAPNVEGLGLEAAGVAFGREGVTVTDHLQTTNRRIYACGDVASRFKFTHMADALARIVLENALFGGWKKASALHVPWCTYTSPEVAHVGLYPAEAEARGLAVDTLTIPMADVDRGILDGDEGFFRVHLERGRDRILGATLVSAHAGETISEVTLAMTRRLGLGALAGVIHPYPTEAEAIRKAADEYNRRRLTPTAKRVLGWLLAVRRRL